MSKPSVIVSALKTDDKRVFSVSVRSLLSNKLIERVAVERRAIGESLLYEDTETVGTCDLQEDTDTRNSLEKRRDAKADGTWVDPKGVGQTGLRKSPEKATHTWADRQKQDARRAAGLVGEAVGPVSDADMRELQTARKEKRDILDALMNTNNLQQRSRLHDKLQKVEDTIDRIEAKLPKDMHEAFMPVSEVQRVYDETGNPSETELLCGIKQLKIDGSGNVVSFVTEAVDPHDPKLHFKLVSAVTDYDRKQSARYASKGPGFYNIYALSHYLGAVQEAENKIAQGVPVRKALTQHFTGRLLDVVLKAVGEAPSTREEQR